MPKPGAGALAASIAATGRAVFSPPGGAGDARADSAAQPGEARADSEAQPVWALNVGDTWLRPVEAGRMEQLRCADVPGLHRYCGTQGVAALLEAVVQKLRAQGARGAARETVLACAGATSGLACAVSALADPGESVLLLAPFWPLIRGVVRSQRATPVELPFFDRIATPGEAAAALEAACPPNCVALYYSNPSNPTGRVLAPEMVEALAAFARRRDLWILCDEVYEDYAFRGECVSAARFAPERTISAFSFSKAYGMAGNRCGYLLTPNADVCDGIHRASVHSAYHAPTAAQWAGLRALQAGGEWLARARGLYRQAGEATAAALKLPAPEGGCFLFFDVAAQLDERGMTGFLQDCWQRGVLLAPGASSGQGYESWVRLCYTAVPPQEAEQAARRVAELL